MDREIFNKFIKNECSKNEIEQIVDYFKVGKITCEFPGVEEVNSILEKTSVNANEFDSNRVYDVIKERMAQK
ncbi:hypothetical protein [Flavobacterium adhaerens]|uniref:hypothetical protein n=1 Tax=Flavobacterium adhaerens TaxID=3149043 RepID=UPI0032B608F3